MTAGPAAVFFYSLIGGEQPEAYLDRFAGILQADAYGARPISTSTKNVRLACAQHAASSTGPGLRFGS